MTLFNSVCMTPPTKANGQVALHLHFDQPRSRLGNSIRQRLDEIVDVVDRAARHAHALGEGYEVDGRSVDPEHVERPLSRLAGADAVELATQYLVDPIGKYNRHDVEAFARLRPQRLQRVHRTAVADHADDLTIGTRHRGAGRDRRREAYRTAHVLQPV